MRAMRVASSVVLFAIAVVAVGPQPALLVLAYLAAVSPELWRVDLREHRLPNRLVLPGYLVALTAVGWQWWASGNTPYVALASGAAYCGFLLLLSLAGGMGMGDVKLAGVLGLAAGLASPAAAVVSPVIAFLAGGVVAAVQLARGDSGTSIPFGPYLLAGFWVAVGLSPGGSST
ncbi:hypothetical protein BH10ACT7_BH10ACT7_15470 [soil metagenome]